MKSLELRSFYLHLDGWGDPGYDNEHPDYLPACIEAGGWEGMKELCDTIHDCGYVLEPMISIVIIISVPVLMMNHQHSS